MSRPIASMTGFARTDGAEGGFAWAWEVRSVNGRGLDLKLRVPAGFDGLEPKLRELAGQVLRRGNVGASLTVKREERARLVADPEVLADLLSLARQIAAQIPDAPPPRAELLMGLPGVIRPPTASEEGAATPGLEAVQAGFEAALAALVAARQDEGARLGRLLRAQLDSIAALRTQAEAEADDQPRSQRDRMMESLAALLRDQPGLPSERIAQEVALLATRADVREELDRLSAHIAAARALLDEGTAIGRRFDFLVQEFVRETNTLCSKSASIPLTATGLKLKAVIEQMREQVQNVE